MSEVYSTVNRHESDRHVANRHSVGVASSSDAEAARAAEAVERAQAPLEGWHRLEHAGGDQLPPHL